MIVAGTNGKGSVAALTESALRAAGWKTGLYTSPHLVRANERFRVNGREIGTAKLSALAREVDRARRRARVALTEFEAQTAAAFLAFRREKIDVAVAEVGLGGRLDAVNVLPAPEATAIASIGHDHLDWLGPDLKSVYYEKAGVIREATPHVEAPPKGLAPTGFHRRNEGFIRFFGRDIAAERAAVDWKRRAQRLDVRVGGRLYAGLRFRLLGEHQRRNAALAAGLIDALRRRGWSVPEDAVRRGFASAVWPGRFQVLSGRPPVVADGAHNPEAAESFAKAYAASPWGNRRATLVFGCLKDKDAAGMARALGRLARRVLTVPLPSERSRDAESLARLWRRRVPAETCRNAREAWARARRDGAPVVFTGSLYLVGEALKIFDRRRVFVDS